MFLYVYILGMAGLLVFKQFCVYGPHYVGKINMSAAAILVNLTIDLVIYVFLFITFPRATLVLFLVLEGIAMIQGRGNKGNLIKVFTNVLYK